MAIACAGCCTPLLYGMTGASKNTVKSVLTSHYQLGNWLVRSQPPAHRRSTAIIGCPWVAVEYRS
jgi:hypothetical protein